MAKDKSKEIHNSIKAYILDKHIQRVIIAVITIIFACLIVINGAMPKKYKLELDMVSKYDIIAPRDIINSIVTKKNEEKAVNEVIPEMEVISDASIEVLANLDTFFDLIENARRKVEKRRTDLGGDSNQLAKEWEKAANELNEEIKNINVVLSYEQVFYLISKASEDDILSFQSTMKKLIISIMKVDISESNLAVRKDEIRKSILDTDIKQELKNIGVILSNYIIKPNRAINESATEIKKQMARRDDRNKEIIKKGQRIISSGDQVTEDKLKILEELNYLEKKGKFDYVYVAGLLGILIMLSLLLILYMNNFCKKVFYNRNDLILLSIVILFTLLIARVVYEYSTLAIPIFIATMLISILLDLKLALIINFILTLAVMLMTNSIVVNGEVKFIYLAAVSGAFSAFVVSKANQRNKLAVAGVAVGVISVFVIAAFDIINKYPAQTILKDSYIVFLNGLFSIVITIGLLPFLETTFNIITPQRLLELANPNQPLLRRLLTEAPGTYHHSLMVGNLAEAGTEAIGGNALLARVAAYFHDIGKLKRPGFFKENQLSENPHDKMTANLSSLVISSHIHDGVEMAKKFKIPLAIRDIIIQHHGTTLIAYFYHKAKNVEKSECIDETNFRYEGVKPMTKEAAVVMLADSVEAAVRSMTDRTEGKIEGLIRKITKDKLDDGQFDQCSLTLKDLDSVSKAFMKVFSGYFHAREEYPDIKKESERIKANITLNQQQEDGALEEAVKKAVEEAAANKELKEKKEE